MTYPLILNTLREFGLITEEQMVDAYREYEQNLDEGEDRRQKFRAEWQAEYDARPWWRRWFSLDHRESWSRDWYAKPIEERYPWSAEDQRIQDLLSESTT